MIGDDKSDLANLFLLLHPLPISIPPSLPPYPLTLLQAGHGLLPSFRHRRQVGPSGGLF